MTARWGILATGRIARKLADAVTESDTSELVAVGSRTQAAADAFAQDYGGITAHGSYDALLADDNVDAIYVSTPHPSTPSGPSRPSKPARPSSARSPWASTTPR